MSKGPDTQKQWSEIDPAYKSKLGSALSSYESMMPTFNKAAQNAQFVNPKLQATPEIQSPTELSGAYARLAQQGQQGLLQQAAAQRAQLGNMAPAQANILGRQMQARAALQGNPLALQAFQQQQAQSGQDNQLRLAQSQQANQMALAGAQAQNQNVLAKLQTQAMPMAAQQGLMQALAGLIPGFATQYQTAGDREDFGMK